MDGCTLVGGVYGVAIGGMFAAESMFYRQPDASKVALIALLTHLRDSGYQLFDIQQMTPHLKAMGAMSWSRNRFLSQLKEAIKKQVVFDHVDLSPASAAEGILTHARRDR